MPPHLFAGLRVSDFGSAMVWYGKLLGGPASFPRATEAIWTIGEHRSVYVAEHPSAPGAAVVLVFVDDLDTRLAEIADRGLEPDRIETPAPGVRKAVFKDPDGNEFGFGGASQPSHPSVNDPHP